MGWRLPGFREGEREDTLNGEAMSGGEGRDERHEHEALEEINLLGSR